MDERTIARLNAINRRFYATVADEFDTTRGKPWPGWLGLLPYLKQAGFVDSETKSTLRVLDMGCGNGRFGVFLAQHARGPIRYHGVDNNPALLQRARERLAGLANVEATLEERDIVESAPATGGEYDLVVLFGVLHHIPGKARREAVLKRLAAMAGPDGILAFNCWRFQEYERFQARIAPWPDDMVREPGDYMLDWRKGTIALRYCHYVDDHEQRDLINATGLRELASYRADGQTGDQNLYVILQKAD